MQSRLAIWAVRAYARPFVKGSGLATDFFGREPFIQKIILNLVVDKERRENLIMNGINTNYYNLAKTNYSSNSIGSVNFAQQNNDKLAQLMAKKNGTTYSPSKNGISTASSDFLKKYQSSMTDMLSTANSMRDLNSNGVANQLSVSSSDTKVMDVSSYYRLDESESFEVDVKQLATAQTNTSVAMYASAEASFSGQLNIAAGDRNITINADVLSGKTNEEQLNSLAKEVNRYKMGVTASVVKDGDKVSLKLTGSKTGADNGFSVSGKFAEDNGVSNITEQGKDAVYTVNGSEFTSSSNTASIGNYKIYANFKTTGSANVSVGPDTNKMADSVEDLLDSFNSTLKFLDSNSSKGVGVLKQMKRMILPSTSERSLAVAGITIGKDGTMSLDKTTFKKAMAENPSLIKDVITGSHGLAEGIYQDAQSGLKSSSASLISEELKTTTSSGIGNKTDYSAISNTMQMMNTYSKSGAYNMMNYYTVGSMMNMLI